MPARSIIVAAVLAAAGAAHAQMSPVFTYQGRLAQNGAAYTGIVDLQFKLFTAASAGTQVGPTRLLPDQSISDGLFTVGLDFGAAAFDGTARWLEITIINGGGGGTTLSPRQAITASPYALTAASLKLPFTGSGSDALDLLNLTQNGLGSVLEARTTAGTGPTVRATQQNSGGSAGVFMTQGFANTAPALWAETWGTGTGVYAEADEGAAIDLYSFQGPALNISRGSIKVEGVGINTQTPVFIHLVTAGNINCNGSGVCQSTLIDNPMINGDPTAILFVTESDPFLNNGTVAEIGSYVQYKDGYWRIARLGVEVGDRFNVLVIKH